MLSMMRAWGKILFAGFGLAIISGFFFFPHSADQAQQERDRAYPQNSRKSSKHAVPAPAPASSASAVKPTKVLPTWEEALLSARQGKAPFESAVVWCDPTPVYPEPTVFMAGEIRKIPFGSKIDAIRIRPSGGYVVRLDEKSNAFVMGSCVARPTEGLSVEQVLHLVEAFDLKPWIGAETDRVICMASQSPNSKRWFLRLNCRSGEGDCLKEETWAICDASLNNCQLEKINLSGFMLGKDFPWDPTSTAVTFQRSPIHFGERCQESECRCLFDKKDITHGTFNGDFSIPDAVIPRESLDRSIGYLDVEPYPDIGLGTDRPYSLGVHSANFASFNSYQDRDTFRLGMKDLGARIGDSLDGFFFEHGNKLSPIFKGASKSFEDKSTGRLFTFWRDGRFEIIQNAIVIWKIEGDKLRLETVLDKSILSSIGSALFQEVHRLGKRHLIVGRTAGGDGGDMWGSVWVGVWTEPRNFNIVHRSTYSGNIEEERFIDFEFDPKSLKLKLYHMNRKWASTDGFYHNKALPWEKTATEEDLSSAISDAQ